MDRNYSNNTAFEPDEQTEDLPEVTGEMLEGLKTLDGSKMAVSNRSGSSPFEFQI